VLIINPRLGFDAFGVRMFDAFHSRHQAGEINELLGRVASGEDNVLGAGFFLNSSTTFLTESLMPLNSCGDLSQFLVSGRHPLIYQHGLIVVQMPPSSKF